jgi:hypothetical protein
MLLGPAYFLRLNFSNRPASIKSLAADQVAFSHCACTKSENVFDVECHSVARPLQGSTVGDGDQEPDSRPDSRGASE